MSKDRKNVSIGSDVNQAIDANDNFSELVEGWARQYYLEGNFYAVERQMYEQMLDSVEASRETMHEQVDEMHDEFTSQIRAQLDHIDTVGENEYSGRDMSGPSLEEAANVLSDVADRGMLNRSNPAVQNWAQKRGESPAELISQLENAGLVQ